MAVYCLSSMSAPGVSLYVLISLFFPDFLAPPCGMQGLSSPTRDQTRAHCSGSSESSPLDCQGSSYKGGLLILSHLCGFHVPLQFATLWTVAFTLDCSMTAAMKLKDACSVEEKL